MLWLLGIVEYVASDELRLVGVVGGVGSLLALADAIVRVARHVIGHLRSAQILDRADVELAVGCDLDDLVLTALADLELIAEEPNLVEIILDLGRWQHDRDHTHTHTPSSIDQGHAINATNLPIDVVQARVYAGVAPTFCSLQWRSS